MSVKTLESYQEFTADGSTTYFTFNFNYVDSSEIIVGMRTGDNQYTVVDPVSYVLTKNASTDGGKIRFVTTKPCENPDDPTCGDYIDNPPPAGTIVRIERKTVQSSTADWYVALDMKALVGLFDKLFRISQENSDKFKNTIQTFPTQQGITVRELLSEHDKKIFYWNNEKQWLDITDFTIDDVVRQTDVGDILAQANAYSDEQNALLENRINGKLTAVNAQIDANADAIQKTREDYIQADSEIHQILNNHADELTTLHNDVDDLGDQVAGIEEKIPESASATNQLATKADLEDVHVDLTGYATTEYVNAREQEIRDDINQADSELQSQITAQASAITANTTSINGVKAVIPDGTSDTNPLINKQQLLDEEMDIREDLNSGLSELQTQITAQATAIAGKQDQLTAGDNITIVDNVISATGGGGGGDFLPLAGGTMTGNINFEYGSGEQFIGASEVNGGILIAYRNLANSMLANYYFERFSFYGRRFYSDYNLNLGDDRYPWGRAYIQKINSGNGGADIIVPTEGGTLARLEDVATKQDQLVAGDNIVISGNTISATGAGGGAGFDVVVVQELPAAGQKGIIYLLAKDGAAPDVYDEYVWIETTQTFELIGTTQVDLTDYATKEELGGYLPTIGGTMTGTLNINREGSFLSSGKFLSFTSQTSTGGNKYTFSFYTVYGSQALFLSGGNFYPFGDNQTLGSNNSNNYRWKSVATRQIYNGSAIDVPTKGGTMALLEDINAIGGDGTEGQVLTKTADGMVWADASGGDGDIDCGVMS